MGHLMEIIQRRPRAPIILAELRMRCSGPLRKMKPPLFKIPEYILYIVELQIQISHLNVDRLI